MISILLADDEHLIRGAMAALLSLEDDLTVAGQAATGAEAVRMARALRPDVALLDLQLPDTDGVAVAREIQPICRTVIVTSHGLPGHLKRALSAGVRGFLSKTVSADILATVVRTVHTGGRYVDPQLAAEAISVGDSPLTARETDVLALAATGAPIDDIARRANLSPGTVRNYLSSAAGKMNAANRHEAARIAQGFGWI
ncbi:response regulator transcription factor [Catenuloplanes indicus]|uniref:Two-component system response regulator DesR n=1 Tax=Catenuloplanes indicus TaxID=137267 RepID=A0AAE3W883_9ACTN|nr:response regulator transcription factor [Catenuloplanes indicus]MDQ0370484.1 two-component system response regulator DesR [Catenuloplanes indicus]